MKKHKIFVALVFSFGSLLNAGSAFALTASDSTLFTVSIPEEIIVTVNVPQTQNNNGFAGNFLRNKISIEVGTNNRYGLSTILKTKTNVTALTNIYDRSYSIPTLSASTAQSSFPTNYWGFSENDGASVSGTSTYYPLSASGTNLSSVSPSSATSMNADIYFGMKADSSKASGTYTNTVVIAVVGKTSGGTEVDPTPVDDDDNPEVIADETDGDTHTIITETDNTNGTTTREKTVETSNSDGDTTEKTTSSYATPQGMTKTTTSSGVNIEAIAVSGVALVSSIALFIIIVGMIRRQKEDEEDQD